MKLKEFRKNYAHDISLQACKMAYCYYSNGHDVNQALTIAMIIYGNRFVTRQLRESAFWLTQTEDKVEIFVLHTETFCTLRHLLQKPELWQSPEHIRILRKKLITMYGENCRIDVSSLTVNKDLLIGIYNHGGRCAALVTLKAENLDESQKAELQAAATVLAKNAIAWCSTYLLHPAGGYNVGVAEEQSLKYGEPYKEWLVRQPVRFVPEVNRRFEFAQQRSSSTVLIRDYLQQLSQKYGCPLSIATVDILGNAFK